MKKYEQVYFKIMEQIGSPTNENPKLNAILDILKKNNITQDKNVALSILDAIGDNNLSQDQTPTPTPTPSPTSGQTYNPTPTPSQSTSY